MRSAHLALLLTLISTSVAAAGSAAPARAAIVTPLITQALPDLPGKEVLVLTVEYPPGSVDPVHRHDAHAFVYVLEGTIVMGVDGKQPVTLHAGEVFYESPADVHTIGRNASSKKPARFVVFMLKDIGKPALLPAN